jgi:hypothetical protein
MSTHTVLYLSKALARAATDTLNYSPIRIIRSNIGHNSIGSKKKKISTYSVEAKLSIFSF